MSKVPQAWHERLDPLDLVYCRFPDEGWPAPAPKPRPALVLFVAAAMAAGVLGEVRPNADDGRITE